MNDQESPLHIVVTGANRGLGLGFVAAWLASGQNVFALARNPSCPELDALEAESGGRLLRAACDVADDASVAVAAEAIAAAWPRVDLLVNNAGTFGPERDARFETLDFDAVREALEINTFGPMRVVRSLLPLLRKSAAPRAVHVTSLMGSIADNTSGGRWSYRLSKAALNMAGRNFGHELGFPNVVLHPGWVRTGMGGPGAPLGIDEAVAEMVATIERVGPEQNGTFIDRHGAPLPW